MKDQDFRKIAEELWSLLDDIDTASDIFKPCDSNPNSYKKFYSYVMKKQGLRFDYLTSDGYDLYTKNEWKNHLRKMKLQSIEQYEKLKKNC